MRPAGNFPSLPAIVWALLSIQPATADIVTFEAPDDAVRHTAYRVAVREEGGIWHNLPVYDAVVQVAGKDHIGFVTFDSDFSKRVELRVERPDAPAKEIRVRPHGTVTVHRPNDTSALLTLTGPAKVSVEFDGDILNNLLVFANRPETDPLSSPAPGVVYFGPGTHLVGGDGRGAISVADGETIYLAGGAVVYGRIDVGNKNDITIRGRGILSGAKLSHDLNKPRDQLIYVGHARGLLIEGITLLDAPVWNIHLHHVSDAVVRNLKIIAWMRESDGIDPRGCQNLVIDDCFIRNSDDCISIKLGDAKNPKGVTQRNRNITVKNSILWPDKGHPLLIGPEGACATPDEQITENVRFMNIDILRSTERNPDFHGALAIMASDDQTIRNILFQDIRVEPLENGNLIDIRFVNNVYTAGFGKSVENVTFRNIKLSGPNHFPNRILGHDAEHTVNNIRFENLVIDGRPINDAHEGNFEINDFVTGVVFSSASLGNSELFRINVVEESTGWPVPLVEWSTTHNVRFVSDNRGAIAFDLPELTPKNSPTLLFEGTFTRQFANNPNPVPRYECNQILYRVDLDDSKLIAD